MRILVAEDAPKMAEHIKHGLVEAGYVVDLAKDGVEAQGLAETRSYDAMVLDVMMPGKDGFTLVRHLRHKKIMTPVIFLTSRSEVEDRVQGLDAGGDDYLTKPFSVSELLARLRALLRRQRPQSHTTIKVADLELDLISHRVRRGGEDILLTPREFALLEFLMNSSPNPVSKTAITEHVWDQYFDSNTNVVNVYMNHLRRKIDLPGMPPLLHTLRGIGFALKETRT